MWMVQGDFGVDSQAEGSGAGPMAFGGHRNLGRLRSMSNVVRFRAVVSVAGLAWNAPVVRCGTDALGRMGFLRSRPWSCGCDLWMPGVRTQTVTYSWLEIPTAG